MESERIAIKAAYGSAVNIAVPDHLGVALFSSLTDKVTAREVIAKFDIMPLDDFFTDVLNHRTQALGE